MTDINDPRYLVDEYVARMRQMHPHASPDSLLLLAAEMGPMRAESKAKFASGVARAIPYVERKWVLAAIDLIAQEIRGLQ